MKTFFAAGIWAGIGAEGVGSCWAISVERDGIAIENSKNQVSRRTGVISGTSIYNYLSQFNPRFGWVEFSNGELAATRITARMVTTIEQLARFPMSGRSGRVPGSRELVISNTPFIAAYAIDRDRIVILAIYHGAQQWPDAFQMRMHGLALLETWDSVMRLKRMAAPAWSNPPPSAP